MGKLTRTQAQPDNVRDFVRDFCLRMAVSASRVGRFWGVELWENNGCIGKKHMVHEVVTNG